MIAGSKTMQAEYIAIPDILPSHWSNKANGNDRLGFDILMSFENMDVNEL